MYLKQKPEYVDLNAPFLPLQKYGHLSKLHPEFSKIESAIADGFSTLWNTGSWTAFRKLAGNADAAIPSGGPERGRDVLTELIQFPARDGYMVELKVYRSPKVQENATLMLRMHGGGWVVGGHETEGAENCHAAAYHNIVVVSINYRMAPEFPFPYAINDSYDCLLWCKKNAQSLGINPEKIIISGSSAGANLAAALALDTRDAGISGIVAQVLHFPMTCHPKFFPRDKYEYGSIIQNQASGVLGVIMMEAFLDAYLQNPVPDHRHSPLLAASLKDLPPTLIQLAGFDILRDDSFAYAEALRNDHVDVELHAYSGLPHCFPGFMIALPETGDFYTKFNSFLKRYSQ